MLADIASFIPLFLMIFFLSYISIGGIRNKKNTTYELIGNKLTKKKYNFGKAYPTTIKQMIYTIQVDGICQITLDRISYMDGYDYDFALVEYDCGFFFNNKKKKKPQNISFIYYVKLNSEFKKYIENNKIKYNIEIISKVSSLDSTLNSYIKYEILFSIDRKIYPKMKLVDLIS